MSIVDTIASLVPDPDGDALDRITDVEYLRGMLRTARGDLAAAHRRNARLQEGLERAVQELELVTNEKDHLAASLLAAGSRPTNPPALVASPPGQTLAS